MGSDNMVKIFDTTLRDGEQAPGCGMTAEEKLRVAHQLEKLGVDVIEAGFPISSEGDFESVKIIAEKIRAASRGFDAVPHRVSEPTRAARRPAAMSYRNRRLAALALSPFLAVSIAACSSGGGAPPASSGSPSIPPSSAPSTDEPISSRLASSFMRCSRAARRSTARRSLRWQSRSCIASRPCLAGRLESRRSIA